MNYSALLCINFGQLEELNKITGNFTQSLFYGQLKFQCSKSKLPYRDGKAVIARARAQLAQMNGKGLTCTDEDLEELKSRGLVDAKTGLWKGKKRLFVSCNKDCDLGLHSRKLELINTYTGGPKQSVMLAYFAYWTEKMPLNRKDGTWCMVSRKKVAELIDVEAKTKTVDVFMQALVEKGLIKYETRRLFRQRQFKVKINDDFYNKIVAEWKEREIAFNLAKQAKSGVSIRINKDYKGDIINNNTNHREANNNTPEGSQRSNIILSKKEQNYLSGAIKRTLARCKEQTWSYAELWSQLKYALSSPLQRRGTKSFGHAVNRAMWLIREGLWKTPFGYEKYNAEGKAEYERLRAWENEKEEFAKQRQSWNLESFLPEPKKSQEPPKPTPEEEEKARKMADLERRWAEARYGL